MAPEQRYPELLCLIETVLEDSDILALPVCSSTSLPHLEVSQEV